MRELTNLPETYAAEREWFPGGGVALQEYPVLREAWDRSAAVLAEMRHALEGQPREPAVHTVAVSGSLGRMEMGPDSDCDLIVVVNDAAQTPQQRAAAARSVWQALQPLKLRRPRDGGIYATAATVTVLCARDTLGRIDEAPAVYGKRWQLLWDAQPVCESAAFEDLVQRVLARYCVADTDSPENSRQAMLDDLLRYYRSLCVYHRWDTSRGMERWRLRNVKLTHSRLVMFAALVLLLGKCGSADSADAPLPTSVLKLTPLERLAWVYTAQDDGNFPVVANCYARFLRYLHDPVSRASLFADETAFESLRENSEVLKAELVRFLFAHRADWGESFWTSLVF